MGNKRAVLRLVMVAIGFFIVGHENPMLALGLLLLQAAYHDLMRDWKGLN